MKTFLKAGFAQIFSCCPKKLSCPKLGGAAAPLAPPARTPMMVAHNCHGKTKNLTTKTKYLTAKPNTSEQKQNSFGFAVGICFAVRYLAFAVKYLVLPWGLWFCREVFSFVERYFGFAMRFSVLPWGFFVFAVRFLVLPWQLWATVPKGSFWLKMKYFEISVLTANSLYIYRQPLLNQRRRNRVP